MTLGMCQCVILLEGLEPGFDAKYLVYRTNLGKIRPMCLGGFSQIGRMSALSSAGETRTTGWWPRAYSTRGRVKFWWIRVEVLPKPRQFHDGPWRSQTYTSHASALPCGVGVGKVWRKHLSLQSFEQCHQRTEFGCHPKISPFLPPTYAPRGDRQVHKWCRQINLAAISQR
jgi:hypothetical protein